MVVNATVNILLPGSEFCYFVRLGCAPRGSLGKILAIRVVGMLDVFSVSGRRMVETTAKIRHVCSVVLTLMKRSAPPSRRSRSGAYRGAEFALLPQERRALRHFDQGIMRRLHGITGGGVRSGGMAPDCCHLQVQHSYHECRRLID